MSVREAKNIAFDARLYSVRYTRSQVYVYSYDLVVSEVPLGVISGLITLISDRGSSIEERASLRIFEGTFPPSKSGSLQFEGSVRPGHSAYHLEVSVDPNPAHGSRPERCANTFAGLSMAHTPHNVCFYFPRSRRSLWSNEVLLSTASQYLSTLLKSGFSDSNSRGSPTAVEGAASDMLAPLEFDDSDEELDTTTIQQLSEPEGNTQCKFKTIRVTQSTYTSYRSVLCWIGTGYIKFARLKSRELYPAVAATSSSTAETNEAEAALTPQNPYLPLPASPKSVYRLSHLLELSELSALALANFAFQLTPQNVAYELYSDVSNVYPEVRDIALDYAVHHWTEVVKSKAFADVKARDQVEGKTGLLLSEQLLGKRRR